MVRKSVLVEMRGDRQVGNQNRQTEKIPSSEEMRKNIKRWIKKLNLFSALSDTVPCRADTGIFRLATVDTPPDRQSQTLV